MRDTIYALASARGRAGVSVVRVSGPRAFEACRALCGDVPAVRRASVRNIEWAGEVIDQPLVLSFAHGASFTGEESVEFHLHGSQAVLSAVLSALSEQPGLRTAEAGEFTRRALENGQLDLAQVEGLADLIDSETEAQRRHAMGLMQGRLREIADAWRVQLVRAAALIEATIDFVEEDVPVDVVPEVMELTTAVLLQLKQEVQGFGAAERLRDGFEVALVGRPNAGKSTLLNALAGRDAAITSTVAGTTRDIIEVRMSIRGLPVTVLDTAGLRETEDEIEQIGIGRTVDRATAADLRVFLLDGAEVPLVAPKPGDLIVRGKADLTTGEGLAVSGKTGQGVAELVDAMGVALENRMASAATINRARHLEAVSRAIRALETAQGEVWAGSDRVELAAEHLRQAIHALDSLIGRVDVEDLLDEIFSSFCIGK
ncbi:tRNA uridine-5-carboxymethylaminomethyl(34) synthesis GTPase MnmE [Xinfangfangia sp. CPCC 101601]|uniref:tRNA modification GTPase MnmE n=1 Tax=Pseudogemmobacter lacusdianii TaxID=3069608 RepID=A0ABU0VTX3_9RHOB|nr:tRNA uridine-5-carboxymethylaminomethyl(34) synthesis GTPase MnmE [Xinfangfangia sp. CPCC 101601]MDQ2065180.1 tRNA uridine-5-carboxymethylaminomethyl(34) synthesis GTPase MnmE [Xinfangfangia sp. CPCC 101601]